MEFVEFSVKRYRSLLDVKIKIGDKEPTIICGENNIGKTNLLRAMDLFFNHIKEENKFDAKRDIPHHIYFGSQGGGTKTELIGRFKKGENEVSLKVTFDRDNKVTYHQGKGEIEEVEANKILSEFKFLFIESHNVNLPELISIALENDGLTTLDKKRSKQSEALEALEKFIKLSQNAILDIEKEINKCFEGLTDFEGILRDRKIKINFVEFDKLRDVVKTMTSITLHDGNNHGIASKGSGAQRAVFLSLMQFISKNYKENIIWGIDEPEAFLHPKFQKKIFDVFLKISSNSQPIILTTHSQYFVKINNLDHTYLFEGRAEERKYDRKPNQIFWEISCNKINSNSDQEKSSLIKKHLGIDRNDGWALMPTNIIVEGEEDQKYLELFFRNSDLEIPNIINAGGATKIGGYLQFYKDLAKDLGYKPKFICLFDNDEEGRKQFNIIKNSEKSSWAILKFDFIPRFDGKIYDGTVKSYADWEIEDFVPYNMVFGAINKILKKEGYKTISKTQISGREKSANINKQILKYAEECSAQNNPDKKPFAIDNMGRKLLICREICKDNKSFILEGTHLDFIKKLSKMLNDKND